MRLPLTDLTRDLRDLVQMAINRNSMQDLLRRGLEWIGRLAPYDLATVFRLEGQLLVVQAATGPLVNSEVERHVLRLEDYPSIQEALTRRRALTYTAEDHLHGDGDPFDGLVNLPPGHSCMVVPLCFQERRLGVMTLDRAQCGGYPESVVNLVEVYGQLLALAIHQAEEKQTLERLRNQVHAHSRLLEQELGVDSIESLEQSSSPVMRVVTRQARQVAATDTPVLIQGETGTGKERLARAIHLWSRRSELPLVTLNCAAIPAGLIESELFGHAKGAFTGAARERAGRFQIANGGTLFLDEVGELPLELQAKLLRVLQEGTFEPVGSSRTVKVDVRILAATHVDLARAASERRFRDDLFYRLNVFPITLPPLRERLEDIPRLCEVLLGEQARRTGRAGMRLTPSSLAMLCRYHWPGNVRELANVLERATILSPGPEIMPESLSLQPAQEGAANGGAPAGTEAAGWKTMEEMERRYIQEVLASTRGRLYGAGGAADILDMKPSTLASRMKKLGISRR